MLDDTAEALLSVLNCTYPPPLINVRSASTSSAPSIATSSWVMWTQTQRLITVSRRQSRGQTNPSQHSTDHISQLHHHFHSATIQADRVWAPTYCGSISFPRLSHSFATKLIILLGACPDPTVWGRAAESADEPVEGREKRRGEKVMITKNSPSIKKSKKIKKNTRWCNELHLKPLCCTSLQCSRKND